MKAASSSDGGLQETRNHGPSHPLEAGAAARQRVHAVALISISAWRNSSRLAR